MKNKILFPITYLIFGTVLAIGPYTIFPVCRDTMMPMRCQNTAKAELILGVLTVAIGTLLLLIKHEKVKIVLNTLIIPVGILAFLFPNVITGVCSKIHMSCRVLTLPSLSILSIALTVLAAVHIFYLWQSAGKGENFDGHDVNFK
ncbi:MAG: hypothetical protein PWP07_339 [Epulopiscium sp.]|uniref:DUF4418 family protein n=1 Tax=Defluviitalea raffinosedens TaxID=1450156 RepID=A0A7C8LI49_9FIRM|nr:DUF4418 family protein [Defluviitalea raffinosedens]MBZ4667631.1 hypothetical protein [Defluviitaleaceae bacterium]MDK2787114.1 hypothetical protein [Candidatus Epulonipiscium sp.]KAE9634878.1 DUF4418 family protein [Defluviitalea raffinosedens]MBM7685665.1 hypothetical protein [Defluviitalea raffinosedens]HHW66511.1 DUF4418 family protein [Candidatus Epulonipiscium sp.]